MRIISMMLLMVAISGCTSLKTPETLSFPEIRFNIQPQIQLDVAHVNVVQDYIFPLEKPNVEHYFPISPDNAVRTWASDKFIATGKSAVLEIIIQEASVVESSLPVLKRFTTEQSERYDATLKVLLRTYGSRKGLPIAEMLVEVSNFKTAPEDMSINDRQLLFHQMTRELIHEFNRVFENNVYVYFADYIR